VHRECKNQVTSHILSTILFAPLGYYNKSDKFYNKLNVASKNVFRFLLLGLPWNGKDGSCSASGMFANRKVKSLQDI